MRVYLDECIDWRLSRDIIGHEVRTARDMGWSGLKNGELLLRVQAEFDAFITVDRNLAFQQNVSGLSLTVFVLRALEPTNRPAAPARPTARRARLRPARRRDGR